VVLPRRAAEQRLSSGLSDSCRHEASGGKLLTVWSTQNACVEKRKDTLDVVAAAAAAVAAATAADASAEVWLKHAAAEACLIK